MHATVTPARTEHIRHETTQIRETQTTVSQPRSTHITAAFMEQHGVGRLDELAETLDFPLDFQI